MELLLSGKAIPGDPSSPFPIYEIFPNDGDVYCFFGNEEMHNIVDVGGARDRRVVVFAYSSGPVFTHSGRVKRTWIQPEEEEIENESGCFSTTPSTPIVR